MTSVGVGPGCTRAIVDGGSDHRQRCPLRRGGRYGALHSPTQRFLDREVGFPFVRTVDA